MRKNVICGLFPAKWSKPEDIKRQISCYLSYIETKKS